MGRVNYVAGAIQLFCLSIEIIIIVLVCFISTAIDSEALFGYQHGIFKWHGILMIFAYVLWMAQGITIYHWLPVKNKTTLRIIHGTIGLLWLSFAVCGFAIIIRTKTRVDDVHFEEPHERLGLAVFVLTVFQMFIGIAKLIGLLSADKKYMRWHGRMGQIIFCVGLVTIATGVALAGEGEPEEPTAKPYHTQKPKSIAVYVLLAILGIFIPFFDSWASLGASKDDKYGE